MTPSLCVCVPARNEAARLPRLLEALAAQDVDGPIAIALCINNSGDGSADVARTIAAQPGSRLRLHLDQASFPPASAHAGSARRRAMYLGAAVSPTGLLLSTDADCRPPPSWIGANLAAFAGGADMIGGRIVIDPEEPLAPAVQNARDLWDAYWAQVRAIEDAIDPRPWDPPPRHGDHTGASLALPTSLYLAAGGVPLLALGEDRGLVDAGIAAGGRLAHPTGVWTYVSPRQDGRAAGGMADDMRRLHSEAATGDALAAPAFAHWRARAEWRRALRMHPQGEHRIPLEEAALPPMPLDMRLAEVL